MLLTPTILVAYWTDYTAHRVPFRECLSCNLHFPTFNMIVSAEAERSEQPTVRMTFQTCQV